MDQFKVQALIAQGDLVKASDIDASKSYLQIGVFQEGNRQIGPGNANSYAPYAIALSEVGSSFKYEIGQNVPSEGGIIGHRWLSTTPAGYPQPGTVQNYLVLAYNDLPDNICSNSGVSVGLTAQSLWDGQANTNAIISQVGATAGAAFDCANLVSQGKSDWYLPAIHELLKIWYNYVDVGQGIQSAGGTNINILKTYWTSTEVATGIGLGWALRLTTDGFQQTGKATNSIPIRPIRKFSI